MKMDKLALVIAAGLVLATGGFLTPAKAAEAEKSEARTVKAAGPKAPPRAAELLKTLKGKKHPFLLFTDITKTPGHRSGTKSGVLSSANSALQRDFSDTKQRITYRAQAVRSLALAYQITKDKKYADKAAEALLNMRAGKEPYPASKAWGIHAYSLAYDWIQPALDGKSDESIRDQLARLAAEAYTDLNGGGKKRNFVSFANFHGQAYPAMGIAACVLHDYTNPNKLPLSSMPTDWLRAATEYFFVNDKLHSHNCSFVSRRFDEGGFCLMGAYMCYVIDPFQMWFSVYSRSFNRNILEDYPAAKHMMFADLWATLPNRYQSNYGTQGQKYYTYVRGILHLFDEEYRGYMLKYLEDFKPVLPFADYRGNAPNRQLLYLVAEDYGRAGGKAPAWTSFLHPGSQLQVFRNAWKKDSDWLSLVTWNAEVFGDNRIMTHHDQLGFEYYSRGDLLLADGGEVKKLFERHYGHLDHNCLWIEDPRKPFGPETDVYETKARPVYKGNANGVVTPVSVGQIVRTDGLDFLEARVTIKNVLGRTCSRKQALSSPISYTRAVLHVRDGYFVVLDGIKGSQPWTFSNALRFTSLNITPTKGRGKNEEDVGHVNGELFIEEGKPYDWLSRPYKTEEKTGVQTSSIRWKTVNPYKKKVALHVYSIPTPEIVALKHTTRIAGTGSKSEVFYPMLRLRTPKPVKKIHWMTALVARYEDEAERKVSEVKVAGDGSALKLILGRVTDFVGFGKGRLKYGDISTDAEVSLVRDNDGKVERVLLVRGKELKYKNQAVVSAASKISHAAFCFSGKKITGHVNLEKAAKITVLCGFNPKAVTYKADPKDGFVWSKPEKPVLLSFKKQGAVLVIDCPKGAGSVVIE